MTIHEISEPVRELSFRDVQEVPKGQGRVEYSYGLSNPVLFWDAMKLREHFVTDVVGWFEKPRNDWDQYDDNSNTLHLGIYNHDNSDLAVSLRLTPVGSLHDSLSLSMPSERGMRQLATSSVDGRPTLHYLQDLAENGVLEDLTRLANPMPTNGEEARRTVASMMELFGFAAGTVRNKVDAEKVQDVRWLFATTEDMYRALGGLGVQMKLLLADDFNDGEAETKGKSYLCLVEQENAIRHIYDNSDTLSFPLQHLTVGLHKANAL